MRRNTPAFRHGEATSMIRKQTKRRALDENTWDSDCCPRYSYARMISSGNGSSKGPLFCLFLLSLGTCRTMLMTGGFAAFPACTLFEFCTDIHPSPLRYVTKDVPPTSVPLACALWLVGTVMSTWTTAAEPTQRNTSKRYFQKRLRRTGRRQQGAWRKRKMSSPSIGGYLHSARL